MEVRTTHRAEPEEHAEGATVVLPKEAIDELPWLPFGPDGDAEQRMLWSAGGSYGGLLHVRAGHQLPPHVHHEADHHAWILEGEAETLGQRLGPGSYVHIPAGVEHGLKAVSPGGCVLLYLYVRERPPARSQRSEEA